MIGKVSGPVNPQIPGKTVDSMGTDAQIKTPGGDKSGQTTNEIPGDVARHPSHAHGRVADRQIEGQVRRTQLNKTAKTAGKVAGGPTPKTVVGQKIAILATGKSTPVVVAKEFGPPGGFATRYEALALARGANTKSAAIFQDAQQRWHAVETNIPLGHGNPTWSPESSVDHLEFIGQPDSGKWTTAQQTVQQLKKQGLTLNDDALLAAYRDQIAAALGVPATEINIIKNAGDPPDPKKINFNPHLQSYGNAGMAKLDGQPAPLQIGMGELSFDNPFEVISTTFHEATHVRHHAKGNELVKQWQDGGKQGKFNDFLTKQYRANKISLEELETVASKYAGASGPTETVAYLNGFMATFANDRTDSRLIVSSLSEAAQRSPTNLSLPADLNAAFEKELLGRLETYYKGLDAPDRTRFENAMRDVKKQHPYSWLAKFPQI